MYRLEDVYGNVLKTGNTAASVLSKRNSLDSINLNGTIKNFNGSLDIKKSLIASSFSASKLGNVTIKQSLISGLNIIRSEIDTMTVTNNGYTSIQLYYTQLNNAEIEFNHLVLDNTTISNAKISGTGAVSIRDCILINCVFDCGVTLDIASHKKSVGCVFKGELRTYHPFLGSKVSINGTM